VKRSLAPLNVAAARDAFSRPGIARAVLVNFVLILSFAMLDQTFRFFNKDAFGMSALETGLVLAFIGVIAAGVQGGLIRPLAKRFDESALIRIGTFLQAIAFAALALAPTLGRVMLYVGGGTLALGNGLTQPSVAAYVSKRADPRAQGNTLGTNQSVSSLARVFGPAFAGWIYGALGIRWPYIFASVGMLLATLVALSLPSTAKATPESEAPPAPPELT
jgi:MFS family permease